MSKIVLIEVVVAAAMCSACAAPESLSVPTSPQASTRPVSAQELIDEVESLEPVPVEAPTSPVRPVTAEVWEVEPITNERPETLPTAPQRVELGQREREIDYRKIDYESMPEAALGALIENRVDTILRSVPSFAATPRRARSAAPRAPEGSEAEDRGRKVVSSTHKLSGLSGATHPLIRAAMLTVREQTGAFEFSLNDTGSQITSGVFTVPRGADRRAVESALHNYARAYPELRIASEGNQIAVEIR